MSKRKKKNKNKHIRFTRVVIGDWIRNHEGEEIALDNHGYFVNRNNELIHRKNYKRKYGHIPAKFDVHHIDMDKTNNSPDNLLAMPAKLHTKLHGIMRKEGRLYTRDETIDYLKNECKELYNYDQTKYELEELLYKNKELLKTIDKLKVKIADGETMRESLILAMDHIDNVINTDTKDKNRTIEPKQLSHKQLEQLKNVSVKLRKLKPDL